MLAVIDVGARCAEILVVGDGVVVHNGTVVEYDQDNVPDYLGYHLKEPFDDWYAKQTQRLSLKDLTDLSLSTDGIHTFRPTRQAREQLPESFFMKKLLLQKAPDWQPNFLDVELRAIREELHYVNTDDIAIVRATFPAPEPL